MGSLRRHFFTFASNAVSQRRRSAQALLTLASPSTQEGTQSHSCSRLLFGSAERKFVNFTRLYLGGPSWLLGSPNRTPSKYVFLIQIRHHRQQFWPNTPITIITSNQNTLNSALFRLFLQARTSARGQNGGQQLAENPRCV
jgi:hypothetical protein